MTETIVERLQNAPFAFQNGVFVTVAVLNEAASEILRLEARVKELEGEAKFLLDRLDNLEGDLDEEAAREYYGNVAPSASRLRTILQSSSHSLETE